MSGGVAYVWDPAGDFASRCNLEMVGLEPLDEVEDMQLVHGLVQRHMEYTGSTVARQLLADWPAVAKRFVKVMPTDYKRILAEQRRAEEQGETADLMRGGRG
jgi:glutamate synthase (ferredoxin)